MSHPQPTEQEASVSHPPNQLDQLRDVGSVDIGMFVAVHAGRDDKQTPTVSLSFWHAGWDVFCDAMWRECVTLDAVGTTTFVGRRRVLTMTLDDCSTVAGILEDGQGDWTYTVAELRQALGLAACWVSFQDGAA